MNCANCGHANPERAKFCLECGAPIGARCASDEQIEFSRADPAIGISMIGFSTSNSFAHRGLILMDLGRFDEAAEAFRSCEELARRRARCRSAARRSVRHAERLAKELEGQDH